MSNVRAQHKSSGYKPVSMVAVARRPRGGLPEPGWPHADCQQPGLMCCLYHSGLGGLRQACECSSRFKVFTSLYAPGHTITHEAQSTSAALFQGREAKGACMTESDFLKGVN